MEFQVLAAPISIGLLVNALLGRCIAKQLLVALRVS